MIGKLDVKDNELSLGLDLSNFLSKLDNLEAIISNNNDSLDLTLNKFDLSMNVKPEEVVV